MTYKIECVLEHFRRQLPEISHIISSTSPIEVPDVNFQRVDEIVATIITGQMLSRAAAKTINLRIFEKLGTSELHELQEKELIDCGVSKRKAKAIKEFATSYHDKPELYENWRNLPYNELDKQVCNHWGISSWTSSMLAIFHFGHRDVFPSGDGALNRAIEQLKSKGITISVSKAKPYRTYLALYLWKFVDEKLI